MISVNRNEIHSYILVFWFFADLCFLRLNVFLFRRFSCKRLLRVWKVSSLFCTRQGKKVGINLLRGFWRNFRPFFVFISADFETVVVVVLLCVSTSYQDLLSPKSHRVFPCPLASQLSVLVPVSFKYSGDFWDKWIIGIWITQQGTDGEQHFGYGECWRPLWPEDI